MRHRGARAYERLGVETAALSASPAQLVAMLVDGALTAIARAQYHLADKRVAEKGLAISKAIDIIDNGLKASLDREAGGAQGAVLVDNLTPLYDYAVQRLLFANLHNDVAVLDEVAGLLEPLGAAWKELAAAESNPAQHAQAVLAA
jgi:flagellar secretion chaperone FliS